MQVFSLTFCLRRNGAHKNHGKNVSNSQAGFWFGQAIQLYSALGFCCRRWPAEDDEEAPTSKKRSRDDDGDAQEVRADKFIELTGCDSSLTANAPRSRFCLLCAHLSKGCCAQKKKKIGRKNKAGDDSDDEMSSKLPKERQMDPTFFTFDVFT